MFNLGERCSSVVNVVFGLEAPTLWTRTRQVVLAVLAVILGHRHILSVAFCFDLSSVPPVRIHNDSILTLHLFAVGPSISLPGTSTLPTSPGFLSAEASGNLACVSAR